MFSKRVFLFTFVVVFLLGDVYLWLDICFRSRWVNNLKRLSI